MTMLYRETTRLRMLLSRNGMVIKSLGLSLSLIHILMKKVAELPDRSQQIFRMSYLDGLKAAEIAERLDLSVRTVENQLYRSLLYLRKNCSNLFLLIFLL